MTIFYASLGHLSRHWSPSRRRNTNDSVTITSGGRSYRRANLRVRLPTWGFLLVFSSNYTSCFVARPSATIAPSASVREYVFYVFSDFKNVTFYVFFKNIVSKSRKQSSAKVQSAVLLNQFTYFAQSHHCNSFKLFICQSSVIEDL